MMQNAGRRILPSILIAATLSGLALRARAAPVPIAPIPSRLPARPVRPALLESARIRVRVAEAAPTVLVRGYDLELGSSSRIAGFSEWELRCQDGRIRARESGGARAMDLSEPVDIRTPAGFLTVQSRRYREQVRLYSQGSLCEAINVVDLEKYLLGLVNGEFNSRWSEQAIEAQVVAARSYALARMSEMRREHYDVDPTERDQVYDGSAREDHLAARAVDRTRGVILAAADGRTPIKAFYHSSCGGRTELPERVWGGSFQGFRRVPCPYCAHAPKFSWDTRLSSDEIARAFQRGARIAELKQAPPRWPAPWREVLARGELRSLSTDQADALASGERVGSVRTTWSLGGRAYELPVSGARFREWIGVTRLRSSLFRAIPFLPRPGSDRLTWIIEGRGNGHGVGMCQWGAKGMGDQGFKMASILQHYYPGALLRKLW